MTGVIPTILQLHFIGCPSHDCRLRPDSLLFISILTAIARGPSLFIAWLRLILHQRTDHLRPGSSTRWQLPRG